MSWSSDHMIMILSNPDTDAMVAEAELMWAVWPEAERHSVLVVIMADIERLLGEVA